MPTKWWASLTSAIIPIEDATKRRGKWSDRILSTQALKHCIPRRNTWELLISRPDKSKVWKNDCILWFHLQQLQSSHQNITSPQCYATHLDCCLFSLQFLHLAHEMSYKSPEQKWNFTTPSLKNHLKKTEAFKQKASKHSGRSFNMFSKQRLWWENPQPPQWIWWHRLQPWSSNSTSVSRLDVSTWYVMRGSICNDKW